MNLLHRRRFLHLTAGAAVLPAMPHVVMAQGYPARPVRLVVPFVAGGGQDASARLLANRLSEIWGQQVIVENRGGAGGNLGNVAVAQSPADGYTILFASPNLAISPHIYPSLAYNAVTDLAPVTLVGSVPNVMVVPVTSPAKSLKEFIDLAHRNRGKITFASSGVGASPHLSGELFKAMAGIDLVHVPYRGGGPAITDLLAGRIDSMFANLPTLLPFVRRNEIRGLAVTSATRSPFAPEIPTFAEPVPGYEVTAWSALFVPVRTPAEIVAKLREGSIAALSHPLLKQRFDELGMEVVTSTPGELAAFLKAEFEKWGPIVKRAGVKPE